MLTILAINLQGWDFGAVVEHIYNNPTTRIAVALVLADFLSGLGVSVKNKDFRLAETGNYLLTKVIPYFLGGGALQLLLLAVPESFSGYAVAGSYGVWGTVYMSIIGHIFDNAKKLGFAVPDVLTAKQKPETTATP